MAELFGPPNTLTYFFTHGLIVIFILNSACILREKLSATGGTFSYTYTNKNINKSKNGLNTVPSLFSSYV